MKDLTQGPVWKHLISLSAFMAISMVFQTLYFLIDLYFVSGIGKEAVAGVSLAGVVMMIIVALTQMLSVGSTTLISHAVGRQDQSDANLVFNQSFLLSMLVGATVTLIGLLFRRLYCTALGADEATIEHGVRYLTWYIPAMGIQFVIAAMGSALRGTGIVKPTMVVQVLSVVLNAALAPVLIAGWGTGKALGTAGASLATLISVIAGTIAMTLYFVRLEHYVGIQPSLWKPRAAVWKRLATIGLPAGGEFALISLYGAIVYWLLRPLGATAQAGFGIGGRVMQSVFLPVMAVSFAASPLAGQNFGAKRFQRVRETFRAAGVTTLVMMIGATIFCQANPKVLIAIFTKDPAVIQFGGEYLQIVSWNFVASGFIFNCSSIFQALGNTVPSLLCSVGRLVLFVIPALVLASQQGFHANQIWYLSVASIAVHAAALYLWLRFEMGRKLALPGNAASAMAT